MESFREHPEILQAYTRGTTQKQEKIDSHWKSYTTQPHLMVPHSRIR
jgi:hypothetical protein